MGKRRDTQRHTFPWEFYRPRAWLILQLKEAYEANSERKLEALTIMIEGGRLREWLVPDRLYRSGENQAILLSR